MKLFTSLGYFIAKVFDLTNSVLRSHSNAIINYTVLLLYSAAVIQCCYTVVLYSAVIQICYTMLLLLYLITMKYFNNSSV
jgi:hypothetical protein